MVRRGGNPRPRSVAAAITAAVVSANAVPSSSWNPPQNSTTFAGQANSEHSVKVDLWSADNLAGDLLCSVSFAFTISAVGPAELCALEHGSCKCDGEVRYGVGKNWTFRPSSPSIECTNDVFGDPAFGTMKACYCIPATGAAPTQPPPVPTCANHVTIEVVDVITSKTVGLLTQGASYDLEGLETDQLTLVARWDGVPELESVAFYLNSDTVTKVENEAPYSLLGDVSGYSIFEPWTPMARHQVAPTLGAVPGGKSVCVRETPPYNVLLDGRGALVACARAPCNGTFDKPIFGPDGTSGAIHNSSTGMWPPGNGWGPGQCDALAMMFPSAPGCPAGSTCMQGNLCADIAGWTTTPYPDSTAGWSRMALIAGGFSYRANPNQPCDHFFDSRSAAPTAPGTCMYAMCPVGSWAASSGPSPGFDTGRPDRFTPDCPCEWARTALDPTAGPPGSGRDPARGMVGTVGGSPAHSRHGHDVPGSNEALPENCAFGQGAIGSYFFYGNQSSYEDCTAKCAQTSGCVTFDLTPVQHVDDRCRLYRREESKNQRIGIGGNHDRIVCNMSEIVTVRIARGRRGALESDTAPHAAGWGSPSFAHGIIPVVAAVLLLLMGLGRQKRKRGHSATGASDAATIPKPDRFREAAAVAAVEASASVPGPGVTPLSLSLPLPLKPRPRKQARTASAVPAASATPDPDPDHDIFSDKLDDWSHAVAMGMSPSADSPAYDANATAWPDTPTGTGALAAASACVGAAAGMLLPCADMPVADLSDDSGGGSIASHRSSPIAVDPLTALHDPLPDLGQVDIVNYSLGDVSTAGMMAEFKAVLLAQGSLVPADRERQKPGKPRTTPPGTKPPGTTAAGPGGKPAGPGDRFAEWDAQPFKEAISTAVESSFARIEPLTGLSRKTKLLARVLAGESAADMQARGTQPCYRVQRKNMSSRSPFQANINNRRIVAQKAVYVVHRGVAPADVGTWQVMQTCCQNDRDWWCFEPTHLARCEKDHVMAGIRRNKMPDKADGFFISHSRVRKAAKGPQIKTPKSEADHPSRAHCSAAIPAAPKAERHRDDRVPTSVTSPLHPRHPLDLAVTPNSTCSSCESLVTVAYRCESIKYFLCVPCAQQLEAFSEN